jgi:cob(I)alamin adenosyltransferase
MIHIYTGEGKGKTTAAFGLAMRSAGAGKKVFIGQFLKGKQYSELKSFKKIKNITIEQFGTTCFVGKKPQTQDLALAEKGLNRIREIIKAKQFDIVILDEANIAIRLKILKLNDILEIIKCCPSCVELILTGRYAPEALKKRADYVTEMKEIRHPFKKNIPGRKGIEF